MEATCWTRIGHIIGKENHHKVALDETQWRFVQTEGNNLKA